MTEATTELDFESSSGKPAVMGGGLIVVLATLLICAIAFVFAYATQYLVRYDATTFGPYWPRRGALLIHIGGGVVALLTAPWQFWSGFRRMPMTVHRLTGRIFVAAVALGSVSAIYLSLTTTFGWAFGLGTVALNLAWIATTGMAYYAIRHRLIDFHKQWMIRAYVVTFAFVIIRLFNDCVAHVAIGGKGLGYHDDLGWLGRAAVRY